MIAKIGRSSNLYGALAYDNQKVEDGNGEILHLNKMIETANGQYSVIKLMQSFESHIAANRNTEKHTLHISLNPDPQDKVDDETFSKIANEYMNEMGYGNQPYAVFKHTDIDRTHIHIVSVCVDEEGRKISDRFEKRKSMEICRDLEKKYHLKSATEKETQTNAQIFRKVDYASGDVKRQIANVIRNVQKYYHFKTLGEYNALLSLFNINVEKIEGELHGKLQRGLVYSALDGDGNRVGHPFKSSLFGKNTGLSAMDLYFLKCCQSLTNTNIIAAKKALQETVDQVLNSSKNEEDFIKKLVSNGINTVVRRNDLGRIYGITFIDHHSKTVWNGSGLGKEYAANAFQERWKESKDAAKDKSTNRKLKPVESGNREKSSVTEIHPLFDFLQNNNERNDAEEVIQGLGGLLNFSDSEDSQEHDFARRMKVKRKKRH
ncbi:conjugal transfer protein MobB [Chryseobacterium turcicum]|uniref:Relaxase/mobilization nuclease domain-containing protein n=1 Tax=Chryseobacterium turcicum TaxID=2898076 RepID=A0A9Q3V5H0_9FLAO|nr:conjugal transfer protein MobB [Chryseobacterium turcicum]MCD1117469.1 relaxase/mobilization nuclease domain-containing protein [Chryseobacterium turcicum]